MFGKNDFSTFAAVRKDKDSLIMATITISYNARSSKARNALRALFSTGLFSMQEPNETTLSAIRECNSDAELDDFDPSSLDAYVHV